MPKMLVATLVFVLAAAAPGVAGADVAVARLAQAKVEPAKSAGKVPQVTVTETDYVLGDRDAPVTILEFASLTCPHCAEFDRTTVTKLKESYIKDGKVKLVFRDFPLDRAALAASVIARCGGKDRYFGFLHTLFASQSQWARATDPVAAVARIGRLGGMSQQAIETCLKDQALIDSVLQSRIDAQKTYGVSSTPTIVINGEKYVGDLSFEQIKLLIEPLLPKS